MNPQILDSSRYIIILIISRTRSEHHWSSDSRVREKHVVRKTELDPRDVCGYKDLR